MAKQTNKKDDLEIQEALTTSGQWIIKNQNIISWCVTGVVLVILAIMAFNNFYLKPKNIEAQNAVGKAVVYFSHQQYELALEGNDDFDGFEQIASDYSIVQGGKTAALYAGLCYYNMGQYEEAIKYLKKYNGSDVNIAPAALMKTGDAYAQLDETEKAVKYFNKAAKSGNELIAPIALKKSGLAYLELGNNKAAKNAFETIKTKYISSAEAQDIDKYISLAQ